MAEETKVTEPELTDDQKVDAKENEKQSRWQKMKKWTSKAWNVASGFLGLSGGDSHSYSDLGESTAGWSDKKGLEEEYKKLIDQKTDLSKEIDGLTKETKGISIMKLFNEYQQIKEVRNLQKLNTLKGEEASLLRERDTALVSLMGGYDVSSEDASAKSDEVNQIVDKLSKVREEIASRTAATQKESVMSKIMNAKEARKLVNKVISKLSSKKDDSAKAVATNTIEGGIGPTVIVKKLDVIQIKIDLLRNELLRRLNQLSEEIQSGQFGVSASQTGEDQGSLLDTISEVAGTVADVVDTVDSVTDWFGKGKGKGLKKIPKKGGFFRRVGRSIGKAGKWIGRGIGKAGKLIGLSGAASGGRALLSKAGRKIGSRVGSVVSKKLGQKAIGKVFKKIAVKMASKVAAKSLGYEIAASIPVAGWIVGAGLALWDIYDLTKTLYLDPKKRKRIADNIASVDPNVWKSLVGANLTQEFIEEKGWTQDEVNALLDLPNSIKEAKDEESKKMVDGVIEYLDPDNLQKLIEPYEIDGDKSLKEQLDYKEETGNNYKSDSIFTKAFRVASGIGRMMIDPFGGYNQVKTAWSDIQSGTTTQDFDKKYSTGGSSEGSGKKYGDPLPEQANNWSSDYNSKGGSSPDIRPYLKGKVTVAGKSTQELIDEYERMYGKKIRFKLKSPMSLIGLKPEVVDEVHALADDIGVDPSEFTITSAVGDYGGHAGASKHYKGMAVDISTKWKPKIREKLYQWVAENGRKTTGDQSKKGQGYWVRPHPRTRTLFENPNLPNEHIHFELNKMPNDPRPMPGMGPVMAKVDTPKATKVDPSSSKSVPDLKVTKKPEPEKTKEVANSTSSQGVPDESNKVASNTQSPPIIINNVTKVDNVTENKPIQQYDQSVKQSQLI